MDFNFSFNFQRNQDRKRAPLERNKNTVFGGFTVSPGVKYSHVNEERLSLVYVHRTDYYLQKNNNKKRD